MRNRLVVLLSSAFVALAAALVNTAATAAAPAAAAKATPDAGSDPTQIGDHIKDIFQPNAKSIWFVAVAGALLIAGLTRRAGRAAGLLGTLAVAGIVIYNPAGLGDFMHGLAARIW